MPKIKQGKQSKEKEAKSSKKTIIELSEEDELQEQLKANATVGVGAVTLTPIDESKITAENTLSNLEINEPTKSEVNSVEENNIDLNYEEPVLTSLIIERLFINHIRVH
jgi:hypothetical protein